ncbi:hypothetical protein [uncultured Tenacibaculum sp.]|uniref:hypothetical protein n=1 Tax=uncultured Tenacibaculum sp. TaxID=174713 RepID=UPI0026106662|nr:hypothetical protein [uncultured Tenacibaculum sp.]
MKKQILSLGTKLGKDQLKSVNGGHSLEAICANLCAGLPVNDHAIFDIHTVCDC